MEALGINIGYLLLQLLCFGLFILGLVVAVYLSARMAFRMSSKIDDSELVMAFEVTEDGIVIPKSVLQGAEKVELRQTKTKLILHLIVDE